MFEFLQEWGLACKPLPAPLATSKESAASGSGSVMMGLAHTDPTHVNSGITSAMIRMCYFSLSGVVSSYSAYLIFL